MRFSFKIFAGLFLIIGCGALLFFMVFMDSLKPGFRQSTEDTLVDTANLLAEIVAVETYQQVVDTGEFAAAMALYKQRHFDATIGKLRKNNPSLQVYITDLHGKVVYDSTGLHVGADFSRWNDIYLTLQGHYGARSTLANPDDELSSVMHVAAPIYHQQQLIGVLTINKPNLSVQPFFQLAQQELTRKGLGLLCIALLAGLGLSLWLSRSIRLLAHYAEQVSLGQPASMPKIYGVELEQLARAMTTMKTELEGKQYVERYVQTLTHQLKAPLAAIIGAAELLDEHMPEAQRARFIGNIEAEAQRLQQIVQRMLALADLENRDTLAQLERINLAALLADVLQTQSIHLQQKALSVNLSVPEDMQVAGERFLVQQALNNLLDNAIDFAETHSVIDIKITQVSQGVTITLNNTGALIPAYAQNRLLERFYSLPRPGSVQKSSGLGLCLVNEVARLHHGSLELHNRADQLGVEVIFTLHTIPTQST